MMRTFEDAPVYEIYALKYAGPLKRRLAMLLWMEGWDEEIEENYYIWVIKGRGEILVVDVGMRVTLAEEQKVRNFVDPVDVLERVGVTGNNLRRIILTHLHFDHAGGIDRFAQVFPEATFFIQEKEFNFWLHDPIARRGPMPAMAKRVYFVLEILERARLVRACSFMCAAVMMSTTFRVRSSPS